MKKWLAGFGCAFLLLTLIVSSAFPVSAEGSVCFVSIRDSAASDENDGKTPEKPKMNFGTLNGTGAVSAVRGGGTIVASGKLYVPSDYTLPDVGGKLLITAAWNGKNYKDMSHPADPSTGVLKIYPAATFRLCGDVTIDDIIIFQEYAQSIIRVASGATVTIGKGVSCFKTKDYYMAIEVEKGGTLILNGGLFSSVSGEGTVIDNRPTADREISDSPVFSPDRLDLWQEKDTGDLPALPERAPTPYTYPRETSDAEREKSAESDQTLPVIIGGCVMILAVSSVVYVLLGESGKAKKKSDADGASDDMN